MARSRIYCRVPARCGLRAIESNSYRSLDQNQRVEFDITQGQKGPQAEHVRAL